MVEDSSGNFYGTTPAGGTANVGTIFEIAAGTHTVTTLASFTNANGSPDGNLTIDANGDLFGPTGLAVCELAKGSSTITNLATFSSPSTGYNPFGNVVEDSSGDLFGTTASAGASGDGTIFEIVNGSNTITTLASFTLPNDGFSYNEGLSRDSNGDLFGTASTINGSSIGIVFELANGSHTITTLATVPYPLGGVILDSSGNLFGTTSDGGSNGDGTIFEVSAVSHTLTTLASLTGTANGAHPYAGLVEDSSGDLFGTTSSGGADGDGTVFEVVAGSNVATNLLNFTGTNGNSPQAPLVEDSNGNLYGTTYGGGANGNGTVFELSTVTGDSFTVTATDASRASTSQAIDVAINSASPLTITTTTLSSGTVGASWNHMVVATGGVAPISFSVSAGNLPTGLTLNSSTGAIIGTPTTTSGSPFAFTITATDADHDTAIQSYSVVINATLMITSTTLPSWNVNQPYSQTITVSGGTTPDTFAVKSGGLPTGLTLNTSTGAITGTPTTTSGSPFAFTITTTDAAGAVASHSYSVSINVAPTITTTTLPNGMVNVAYSQTISVSGGTSPDTYSVSAGSLPAGLSLNTSTGAITGTPTTASSGGSAPSLSALASFTSSGFPNGAPLVDSSGNVFGTSQSGGSNGNGYVYEVAAGSHTVTMLVTFNGSGNGSGPMNGLIEDSSGNIYGATAFGGADGDGTIYELAAGTHILTTLVTFNGTNGSIPNGGLVMDNSGNLFDTTESGGSSGGGVVYEVAAGTHALTVLANFTGAANGSSPYGPLYEDSSGNLFGTTGGGGSSGDGTVWEVVAGSHTITTLATFTGSNGSDPNGHVIEDSSGNIYGTTSGGGASGDGTVFEVAANTHTLTDIVTFTGSANGGNPVDGLIQDSHGNMYGSTGYGGAYGDGILFELAAGTHAFTTLATFAGTNGAHPYGELAMDGSGDLYGATTGGGASGYGAVFELNSSSTFTITATDATGAAASQSYNVTINAYTAPTISTTSLPNWTIDRPYSQTVVATGGTAPVIFNVSAGSLPTGLSLNTSTGAITGTPTTTTGSPFSFTITATDAFNNTGSEAYSIAISTLPTITTTTLPNWTVKQPYSRTLGVSSGTAPDSFTVTSGSLPAGLSLTTSTGVISGTPTATGSASFTISVTDAAGAMASQSYSVTINPSLTITTTTLPNGTVNQSYSSTINVSGGTSPDTFAITAGSLPTGLSLNSNTGAITGTPTASGNPFTFTVTATDAADAVASNSYSVIIIPVGPVIITTLPNWTVNTAYSQTLAANGGTSPYTYAVTSGSLPTGLSFNSSAGTITGTPTTTSGSPFAFTITVTDAAHATSSKAFGLTINAAPAITTTTLSTGVVGQSYSQPLQSTGGTGTTTYAVTAGSLPAGLSLNTSTGAITGTPTATSSSSLSYTANVVSPLTYYGTNNTVAQDGVTVDSRGNVYVNGVLSNGLLGIPAGSHTISDMTSLPQLSASAGWFVTDSHGNLYGTTQNGDGTVCEIPAGSTTPTTLAAFNVTDGANPTGYLLIDSSGNIYGTTIEGGANGDGTLFEIKAGTETVTTLVNWSATNGTNPNGLMLDSNGNIFGTTYSEGANGSGTVFELAAGSHTFSTIYSFNGGSNGGGPEGQVVLDSNGDLFGVTNYAGPSPGYGTVYELAAGSHAFSTLVDFAGTTNGATPKGGLVEDSSGNIFGTTTAGGASSDGTLFELAAGTHAFSTVVTFTGSNGVNPEGDLTVDAGGDVYGVTGSGGASGGGTIYEVSASTHVMTIDSLPGKSLGTDPATSMIEDSSGDIFAASSSGTVYEIIGGVPTVITTLGSNIDTNSNVLEDSSGDLLGTTTNGGSAGEGSVFEIAAGTTTVTTLISFTGTANGSTPGGELVKDSNGNIFGTTSTGGASGDGTVFEIAANTHAFTTLVTFTGTANGSDPASGLVEDSNGNLFGTTSSGGANGEGTVYELAAGSHSFSTLISFSGTVNGDDPVGTLVEDSSGNLYGAMESGGTGGDGTVFELAAGSNTLTTVINFNGSNGKSPQAGLTEDSGGDIFGTTYEGGANNVGTVFELTAGNHQLTTLFSFPSGVYVSTALSGLLVDGKGNIFGTASDTGVFGDGEIFELSPGNFTITATDAAGAFTTASYSLTINPNPAMVISTTSLPSWTVNRPYNQTVAVSGGVSPVTFSVSAGTLPTGLSLNSSSGVISGTPTNTTGSPFNFTITATDADNNSSSQIYSITINAAPTITTTTLSNWTINRAIPRASP